MRGRFTQILLGMAALAYLVGAPHVARADTIQVEVRTNFFSPSDVSIATGDTIRWVWITGSHSTISVDNLWASNVQGPGSTFEYTFNQPGDFGYICSVHIVCCNMRGIVHVSDPVVLQGALVAADADPDATGAASFHMVPYRSMFDVTVQGVVSTTGVHVFVNGNFVGPIGLDAAGNGVLHLNTDNGDTVPALHDGDEVEIYDAADDATLILIGNVASGGG